MNDFFNNLFNNVLSDTSELAVTSSLIAIFAAALFGFVIAFTYYRVSEKSYGRSLAVTLVMLPVILSVILSVIILFVGSNVARAFSLAGMLSIIRFRSVPGDPKNIGFIFFDIAAGLACGVGLYGYGALFVVILCVIVLLMEKFRLFEKKEQRKKLKITIPEDLNYPGVFDEILEKYTQKYLLTKIKTTDLGSLFELEYSLVMKSGENEREFLNELRCRNGNLNIILALEK